jgi:hypothetical protein
MAAIRFVQHFDSYVLTSKYESSSTDDHRNQGCVHVEFGVRHGLRFYLADWQRILPVVGTRSFESANARREEYGNNGHRFH